MLLLYDRFALLVKIDKLFVCCLGDRALEARTGRGVQAPVAKQLKLPGGGFVGHGSAVPLHKVVPRAPPGPVAVQAAASGHLAWRPRLSMPVPQVQWLQPRHNRSNSRWVLYLAAQVFPAHAGGGSRGAEVRGHK